MEEDPFSAVSGPFLNLSSQLDVSIGFAWWPLYASFLKIP